MYLPPRPLIRGGLHVSLFFELHRPYFHHTFAMQTNPNAKKDDAHVVKMLVVGSSGKDGWH
jgi:hypothetical protein